MGFRTMSFGRSPQPFQRESQRGKDDGQREASPEQDMFPPAGPQGLLDTGNQSLIWQDG